MSNNILWLLLLYLVCLALPAKAENAAVKPVIKIVRHHGAPQFERPAACTPGTDCWIMNYPDIGPTKDEKASDFKCLSRTYDGHAGTDLAIADGAAMDKGVDVLAAASGTVLRLRDGEADGWRSKEELDVMRKSGKECGNGVFIDHGDGWQTIYCHMKKGSITVKPGQPVRAGDKLGEVGLSGLTEFPHIHLGITHDGVVLDPFTGKDVSAACDSKAETAPLWGPASGMTYEPVSFFDLGFGTSAPDLERISRKRENRAVLPPDASALVFHAVLLGIRQGDEVTMSVTAPDGTEFARNDVTPEKNRARQMYYVGRKVKEGAPLAAGIYTGRVTVKRVNNDGIDQTFNRQATITVE